MRTISKRNISTPDEVRPFPHGHMDVVTLGEFTLGRGTFEPGWRWSYDVRPIAGTEYCQVRHTAICIAGRMAVSFSEGPEVLIEPGDVLVLEPGHDAWTVGNTPCVMYDTGIAGYAVPPPR